MAGHIILPISLRDGSYLLLRLQEDYFYRVAHDIFLPEDKDVLEKSSALAEKIWGQDKNIFPVFVKTQRNSDLQRLFVKLAGIFVAVFVAFNWLAMLKNRNTRIRSFLELTKSIVENKSISHLDEKQIVIDREHYKGSMFSGIIKSLLYMTILPLLALTLLLNFVMLYRLEEYASQDACQFIFALAAEIDDIHRNSVLLGTDFLRSPEVEILLTSDKSTGVPYGSYQILIDRFIEFRKFLPEMKNIAFYNVNGENVYASVFFDPSILTDYHEDDLVKLKESRDDYIPFFLTASGKANYNITVGKKIYHSGDYYTSRQLVGYIIYTYDYASLVRANRLLEKGELFILAPLAISEDGIWKPEYFNRDRATVSSMKANGAVAKLASVHTGFWGTYLVYKSNKPGFSQVFGGNRYVYYLCVFLFALFVLLTAVIYTLIMKPINEIKDMISRRVESLSSGNLYSQSRNEVLIITEHFNRLIERIQQLTEENYKVRENEARLKYLEKEAQLRALEQQINPHFLHNTLEVIKWMAFKHENIDIANLAVALGKFYRNSIIHKDIWYITIQDEMYNLQNYFFIQHHRFPDKFDVEFAVDETLGDTVIPKLILQPLVENSIEHGFKNVESGGLVYISIEKKQGRIAILIADNGCGIPKDKLQHIRDNTYHSGEESIRSSIAFSNVYERLVLYMGSECIFNIISEEGKGTSVQILLPYEPKNKLNSINNRDKS
jgi:sensor histidine kinase YesM